LRKIAVIRQKKKAFGLGVEPADVEEPGQMRRKKVEDRITRVRIASGGNKAGRLMEHQVEPALGVNEFAVDFDVITLSWLNAEIGADLAVDCNATGRDQFIAVPPRAKPGRGKETIQAHWIAREA